MNQATCSSTALERAPETTVRFGDAATRAALGGAGTLVLRLERLGATARGRLAEVIDEVMERELAARGATSPGVGSELDPDAALSDQLFRARQVGVQRVCLALGPMRGALSRAGALQAEDTATLLFWARATRDRPVELMLDGSDEETPGFVATVPLREALLPSTEPEADADSDSDSESPSESESDSESGPVSDFEAESEPESVTAPAPATEPGLPPVRSAMARHTAGVVEVDDGPWRSWALELNAAKGPQPLAAFERLFVHSYMPLCDAVDRGLGDPRAVRARDEFRATFARMYTEACPTFAATGKRPRMVFDAPDVAARMARLHGARTVQLLLAAGMRADVTARVREDLAARLSATAQVADDVILWSALPTTTSRQLDCLTRGPDALRDAPPSEAEVGAVRGRTMETVRRVKTGSRDVFKLDVCEARVREAAAGVLDAIPSVARTIADVLARHAGTLAPRTLLFVFGDHGFSLDAEGIARHGGATPEEVLVPAFALLVGEVH